MDQIARYLKVSPRTVSRWIHDHGLLVVQGPSAAYWTSTSLIDLWLLALRDQELKSGKYALRVSDATIAAEMESVAAEMVA